MAGHQMNDAHEVRLTHDEPPENLARLELAVLMILMDWNRSQFEFSSALMDQPWILAVSGGADSMAMLHSIHRMFPEHRLIVAHMNHHAREESDVDERFVREAAESLGLTFEVGHWRPVRTSHFESDARRARHEWFASLAARYEAGAVMTAHTQNDQAETVLMRLARGSGPIGMSGIRPFRSLAPGRTDLVRPLLRVSRGEILAYSKERGIAFREDPTNADVENQTRAWVRHVLVPQFEERLNPRFREAVAHFVEIQAEEQDALDKIVRRRARKRAVARFVDASLHIRLPAYRSFGQEWLRRRLLRTLWADHALPQHGMTRSHWILLDMYLQAGTESKCKGVLSLPGGIDLRVFEDHAEITRNPDLRNSSVHDHEIQRTGPEKKSQCHFELPCPGRVQLEDDLVVEAEGPLDVPTFDVIRELSGPYAILDAARLKPPLFLRRPVPGDRFDPIGLEGRHQKLTDYLRVRGFKGRTKATAWLLEDIAGIVWVVGHGISDRAKVTDSTQSVWTFRIAAGTNSKVRSK